MIAPFLLAVALAASPAGIPAPEPSPEPAVSAAASKSPALDVPITLELKDASVVDLLEKFADLLGVTPILDPGVGGRVTLDVRGLPAGKALELLGRTANVEVSVSGRVLRATAKPGPKSTGAGPAVSPPEPPSRRLGDVLRFWLDGAPERAVTVRAPAYVGRLSLPGCAGPVTIGRLGASGGPVVGVALASTDASEGEARGRILGESAVDGTRVNLPGCDTRLLVVASDAGDPVPGTTMTEPVRVPKGEPLLVALRLLEVTEEEEKSLSEPKIAFLADGPLSVRSGFTAGAPGSYAQEAEIHGVPLEVRNEDESILLAVYAGVTRTPASTGAGPTLVARRAETFRLRKGKPLRWTADSSWDGGRAAIVLELTYAGRFVPAAK